MMPRKIRAQRNDRGTREETRVRRHAKGTKQQEEKEEDMRAHSGDFKQTD